MQKKLSIILCITLMFMFLTGYGKLHAEGRSQVKEDIEIDEQQSDSQDILEKLEGVKIKDDSNGVNKK